MAEACAQLTQEFFKGDTLCRLITSLHYLNLEVISDSDKAMLQEIHVSSVLFDYLFLRLSRVSFG